MYETGGWPGLPDLDQPFPALCRANPARQRTGHPHFSLFGNQNKHPRDLRRIAPLLCSRSARRKGRATRRRQQLGSAGPGLLTVHESTRCVTWAGA